MLEKVSRCSCSLVFFLGLILTASSTPTPQLEATAIVNGSDMAVICNSTEGRRKIFPEGTIYASLPIVTFTAIACLLLLILCLYYRRNYTKYRSKAKQNSLSVDASYRTRTRFVESEDHAYQYVNDRFNIHQGARAVTTQVSRTQTPSDFEPSYCNLHHGHSYYVDPAQSEEALYDQMLRIQITYLLRTDVRLGRKIGSGQFGEVLLGTWASPRGVEVEVAVKTLKKGAMEPERVKFLQEVAMMGQFKHPSIVTMYGVMIDKEPMLLILELLSKGDLRNYLLTSWKHNGSEEEKKHIFLSYCRQIVSGMIYLASKNFVHRDLAARNILVSELDICKIADFGMSRDLRDEDFYVSHGGLIPVKWTAPEAIFYKKYSTASDVWSYGVLLFEIWSVGRKPYEHHENGQIANLLKSGYRLPPPPGCPRAIYSIMIDCWHPAPNLRPSFEDVGQTLSQSDLKLLLWPNKPKIARPKSATLGSNLESGKDLYPDLQSTYKNSHFNLSL